MRRAARAVALWGGLALLARASASAAAADEPGPPPPPSPPSPTQRGWDYVVLPIAYYTPETSLALGGGTVIYDNAPASGAGPRRDDEVSLALIGTLRKQLIVDLEGIKYWRDGRYQLGGQVIGVHFPNRFWGIGNDTPEQAMDRYTLSQVGTKLGFARRAVEELYVGIGVNGGWTSVGGVTPAGTVDVYLQTHRRAGSVIGVGPLLKRDTRDDPMGPHAGSLTQVSAIFARTGLGSDFAYDEYQIDQRTYLGLGSWSVLALTAYGRYTRGDVPLAELPALGGAQRLRGYFEGRFRDNLYLMAQAEWRIRVVWRLSVAPFGGVGNVFPDLGAVTLARPKVAAGVGLRVNLKKDRDLNLRLDLAKSPISSGVYVNLGEAF